MSVDSRLEKIARTPWLRAFLRFFIWDLQYHCPTCGKRLERIQWKEYTEAEQQELDKLDNVTLAKILRYSYKCKNAKCPEFNSEHVNIIG